MKADSGAPTVAAAPVAAAADRDRDPEGPLMMVPAKCIRQPAQTAERNVKFRSGLLKEDQCTVMTASLSTENPDTNQH